MLEGFVTQVQGQKEVKWDGIETEEKGINEERLKEKEGEQKDFIVGKISSGPSMVAHESLGSKDKMVFGAHVIGKKKSNTISSEPVSLYGPNLVSNKVGSSFNFSSNDSSVQRSLDSCGSILKNKMVVDSSTGFNKRKSGRELKLGISREKFKVCGGKRKLDLVGKGDFVRCKKIRRKYGDIREVGFKEGNQLEGIKNGLESSSLEVTSSTVSPEEMVSDLSADRSFPTRWVQ